MKITNAQFETLCYLAYRWKTDPFFEDFEIDSEADERIEFYPKPGYVISISPDGSTAS